MAANGQAAALRDVLARLYAIVQPRRLAVLGCTTGNGLDVVDPTVTSVVCGVDVNAEYLELAEARLARLGDSLVLVCGDACAVDLPPRSFDLVHAALLLEYVEPRDLFARIASWLAPTGLCSVVIQNAAAELGHVSRTPFTGAFDELARQMRLRAPDEVTAAARAAGFDADARWRLALPDGKSFEVLSFRLADGADDRREGAE